MQRYQREILYRPRCRNADRAWWLARFAVVVCALVALMLRYGLISFDSAWSAFVAGLVLAVLAIVLALAAFVRIWREDDRGIGKALLGFLCAVALIAVPVALYGYQVVRPGSDDISTDIGALPPFSRTAAAFSARGGTIPSTPPDAELARQATANPDLGSLAVDTDPYQLFLQVQEIARDNGWTIVAARAPGERFGDGHVDMVLTTQILRLPVDMTVRIRPVAGGTRVDVRCVSRHRRFDYTDNAAIVRDLLLELAQGPPLG